jgi:hypothetical protein
MTPAAALARHLEWLEYALAAARDEEGRRRDRLARATNKNRDKRTARLAEVTAEVTELAALLEGIKSLQAQPARASAAPGSTRTRSAKPGSARKTTAARKTTGSRRSTKAAAKPASARSATKPPAADTSGSTNGTEPKAKKPATRRRSSTGRSGSSS